MSRSARIDPDSPAVLLFAIVVTVLLAAVSFALSFAGLVHVAVWAAVPPSLSWVVPAIIDGAQLVFTAGALVHRARGDHVGRSWAALVLFAAVSVAGNALHAWDAGQGDWRAWVGVVIAGLAPLAVVLSVHELASLVVARPAVAEAVTVPALAVAAPAEAEASRGWDDVPLFDDGAVQPVPVPHPADVDGRMRELRAAGLSVRAIAEAVGLSRSTVSRRLASVPAVS